MTQIKFTVKNNGPNRSTGTVVLFYGLESVTLTSPVVSKGSWAGDKWVIGALDAGESVQFEAYATNNGVRTATVTAFASGEVHDADLSNNEFMFDVPADVPSDDGLFIQPVEYPTLGRRIHITAQGNLDVVEEDGTTTRLPGSVWVDSGVGISRDGVATAYGCRYVAYIDEGGSEPTIRIFDLENNSEVRVIDSPPGYKHFSYGIKLSVDGSKLIYMIVGDDNSERVLHVMDIETGDIENQVTIPGVHSCMLPTADGTGVYTVSLIFHDGQDSQQLVKVPFTATSVDDFEVFTDTLGSEGIVENINMILDENDDYIIVKASPDTSDTPDQYNPPKIAYVDKESLEWYVFECSVPSDDTDITTDVHSFNGRILMKMYNNEVYFFYSDIPDDYSHWNHSILKFYENDEILPNSHAAYNLFGELVLFANYQPSVGESDYAPQDAPPPMWCYGISNTYGDGVVQDWTVIDETVKNYVATIFI